MYDALSCIVSSYYHHCHKNPSVQAEELCRDLGGKAADLSLLATILEETRDGQGWPERS